MLYSFDTWPASGARVKITRYASGSTERGTQENPTFTATATVVNGDADGLILALDQPFDGEESKPDHYDITSQHAWIRTGGRYEWTIETLDVVVINAAILGGPTDLDDLSSRLRETLEAAGCTILRPLVPPCVRTVAHQMGTDQVRVLDLIPAEA